VTRVVDDAISAPAAPARLAYVVKYYRPMPRISGILTFVHDLVGRLARTYRVGVFTSLYSPRALRSEQYRGYEIRRLGGAFPWSAGRAVRRWKPDAVVFGSGFWRPQYLLPYWEVFRAATGRLPAPVLLTQYTTMSRRRFRLLGAMTPSPDAVVCTTPPLRDDWEKLFPGKTVFIPAGVETDAKASGSEGASAPGDTIRVGYFGHLEAHKGPDLLLEEFIRVAPANAQLLIHGEGPLEGSLRRRARGREDVLFQGYVPDTGPWLRSCSLLVFPYRSSVSVLGYSRAALEALAAGIPILSTATEAVAPLIEEGVNGYVCAGPGEIGDRLRYLLERPRELERMRAGAAASARPFDIGAVADSYRRTIDGLLEGP